MPHATPADAISAAPRWSGAVLPGCVSTTRPAAAVANPIHSSAPERSPLTTLHVKHRQLHAAEEHERAAAGVDPRVGEGEGERVDGKRRRADQAVPRPADGAGSAAEPLQGEQRQRAAGEPYFREGDRVDEMRPDRSPGEEGVCREARQGACHGEPDDTCAARCHWSRQVTTGFD